jgi:hypothetical protein
MDYITGQDGDGTVTLIIAAFALRMAAVAPKSIRL